MEWDIEFTDEFGFWWDELNEAEQDSIDASVGLLEALGPNLDYPHSSKINGSKYSHMRELRIQHAGSPYRILYAFDPRRTAILLIGGCKEGKDSWYKTHIPVADKLYEQHLIEIGKDK